MLPFIEVDIYTTSRGIITSHEKPVTLYAPVSGRITYFNLIENMSVSKGDTLLVVNQSILEERDHLMDSQKEDIEDFIVDLNYLIKGDYSSIKTNQYQKEYIRFQQQLFNVNTLIKNTNAEYNRSNALYQKGVIAKAEYDRALLDLNKLKNDKENTIKQSQLTWQKELTDYKRALEDLESNKKQLEEEKTMYVLIAPIDGELINVQGYNQGSVLSPGSTLANISPSKNLVIESYLSPTDIGYIKEGVSAKYQVDSYNSNQWGFATGKITEVGKDIVQINNRNIFKVRSSLNETYLSLINGAQGQLKKGMTVTSRFFLIRRSLYDLLFDSIDDWFNPYNPTNE
ncbi:HlyD family efflux transporter periplasmic adaptor subunit [Lacinutrix neustonica]|uniref:HlyD family efflux transporter periplasmic adaptor subunit n=1 Tax=Lacinutrix neustonica TaxID=2980107 RepID=A0A9E8MTI4_9FLAO|nr:HlyD family efflux transporter periplasmic adaptor subunit [Lacinutrix neustonica]WAC01061.1 HlyD family efflux transporter periplasmic adaptor subunit [Lacinutrix neustonica]